MKGAAINQEDSFWDRPEQVERFASREPDRRLLALLGEFDDPASVRVLDLGCAGGRNTVVLAELGFDFHAIDSSRAMVERTRERVAELVGEEEARRRVRVGAMEDLKEFGSGSFHLVVALGVYHNASSPEAWGRALRETARVLVPSGRVLVANRSPRSASRGEPARPVPGTEHLYEGVASGRLYLVEADDLNESMRLRGLEPVTATGTVVAETDEGCRVTVNGLYRKR